MNFDDTKLDFDRVILVLYTYINVSKTKLTCSIDMN